MRSKDIYLAKLTIKKFLSEHIPSAELQRLILKEVYEEVQREAVSEIQKEISEKGDGE